MLTKRNDAVAAAVGRWPHILAGLGIDPRHLINRHGPCPGCGGTDRFRFDDRDGRGTWVCGGGGAMVSGDGFQLLEHVQGIDRAESFRRVRQWLDIDSPKRPRQAPPRPPDQPRGDSGTKAYALSLWAVVDRSDDAVARHPYAIRKRIDWHAAAGLARASGRVVGANAECIVVPIREVGTGTVAAVQCINADGVKQTFGPVRGNAFVLGNVLDTGGGWYIVEGWADAAAMFAEYHRSVVFAAMGKSQFDYLTQRVVDAYRPRRLVIVEDAE